MANYSAAFGYDVYILPLLASEVDSAFTGITTATGTSSSTAFLKTDDAVAGDGLNIAAADSTISYAPSTGIFTVESVAYNMDGTDKPFRLYGLTNASLETDTNSEDIVTYDDETRGFNVSVATSKSWSVTLEGVADFKDAAYQVLRLTEQNTVANGLRVKFVRVGPTGTSETIYGYGTLSGYSESVEAGSIVSWSADLVGYGAYQLAIDANA